MLGRGHTMPNPIPTHTPLEWRTVVRFLVDLGHSLGLRCTAEGVSLSHRHWL